MFFNDGDDEICNEDKCAKYCPTDFTMCVNENESEGFRTDDIFKVLSQRKYSKEGSHFCNKAETVVVTEKICW